jgi:N-acetyltransferase
MQIEMKDLVGKRVLLTPMQPEHEHALFVAGQESKIWDYLSIFVRCEADMERLVREAIHEREMGLSFPYVIVERASGDVVGSTRYLDIVPAHRTIEIGWTWLNPAVWRTAINTECKYLLLKHAFETLQVNRVSLKTDARNLRSQQAIERIGGVREGVLRSHKIMPDGYRRDTVYFSILREEWPDVCTRLLDTLDRTSA